MKKVGFEYQETMSGSYTLAGKSDPPRRFAYTARVSAPSAMQHLKDHTLQMEGTLDMEDFADDVPLAGSMEVRLVSERAIKYEFTFCGNDGQPYIFRGQKDIRMGDLKESLLTLLGTVSDTEGAEVGRVKALFDLKADLLPFLISWRPKGLGLNI